MSQPATERTVDAIPPFRNEGGVPEERVSMLELVNVLLKRRRVVIGLPLLAATSTAIVSLLLPPTFTASVTLVPETRSQNRLPVGLVGVAGQLGIALGPEAGQSPRFYAEVLKSRALLERVLLTKFPDPRRNETVPVDSLPLLAILRVKGQTPADSLYRGVRKLDKLVTARVDLQTNMVHFDVDSRYPALAAEVAQCLIGYLNEFNAKTRQSQARERRKFVEQRSADAQTELRDAEDELRHFAERNRSWQESPELAAEQARLRRQVDVHQEVYLTLRREYEQARIEEVNDTPVLTVIDPPEMPQEASRPQPVLWTLLALILAAMASIPWAFGAEYLSRVRQEEQGEYREFRELLDGARRDLRRPLRALIGAKR